MTNNAIAVNDLCKHYKDFSLNHVSFTVSSGCIMGFVGENGAGKTTTLKSILGLIRTDAGSIEVFGKNPAQNRIMVNKEIGVVLDDAFFYEGMRACDVSAVMKRLHPAWDIPMFEGYCKRFSLPWQKIIKEYSKGMKAKLALATALSHHPRLLILDEATSGLDPVVRSEMLDIFMEFIEDENHTILLSSHITSDLEKVADYITFIHNGSIVFSEPKDEMLARYGVVKCTREDAKTIDAAYIVGRRESHFDVELLVNQKAAVRAACPKLLIETATIDDIMTFFAKENKE